MKKLLKQFDMNAETGTGLTNHQVFACMCMVSTIITLTTVVFHISQNLVIAV